MAFFSLETDDKRIWTIYESIKIINPLCNSQTQNASRNPIPLKKEKRLQFTLNMCNFVILQPIPLNRMIIAS